MNIRTEMDGEVEYLLWLDNTDSYYSSSVPFTAKRLAESIRTEPLTRYMLYAHFRERRAADEDAGRGTSDMDIKRVSDAREVSDAVTPAGGEVFTGATREIAR